MCISFGQTDTETRTPSTGSKNNKFVSGLKFSSINVNGIRSKKHELLAYLDFHQPQIVAIQETTRFDVYETLCPQHMLVHKGGQIENWSGECRAIIPTKLQCQTSEYFKVQIFKGR